MSFSIWAEDAPKHKTFPNKIHSAFMLLDLLVAKMPVSEMFLALQPDQGYYINGIWQPNIGLSIATSYAFKPQNKPGEMGRTLPKIKAELFQVIPPFINVSLGMLKAPNEVDLTFTIGHALKCKWITMNAFSEADPLSYLASFSEKIIVAK